MFVKSSVYCSKHPCHKGWTEAVIVLWYNREGNSECEETQGLLKALLTGCIFCCIWKQPGTAAQTPWQPLLSLQSPRVKNATPRLQTKCCHLLMHNTSLVVELDRALRWDLNYSPLWDSQPAIPKESQHAKNWEVSQATQRHFLRY